LLHSNYGTKKSSSSAIVIVCFLSEATKKLFEIETEEKKAFQKKERSQDPFTPLTNLIRKTDIYSFEKRGQSAGQKFSF
jgi:hypothetical protein